MDPSHFTPSGVFGNSSAETSCHLLSPRSLSCVSGFPLVAGMTNSVSQHFVTLAASNSEKSLASNKCAQSMSNNNNGRQNVRSLKTTLFSSTTTPTGLLTASPCHYSSSSQRIPSSLASHSLQPTFSTSDADRNTSTTCVENDCTTKSVNSATVSSTSNNYNDGNSHNGDIDNVIASSVNAKSFTSFSATSIGTQPNSATSSSSSTSGSAANNNNSVRRPLCARCRNHNVMVMVKGHKRYCDYRDCECEKCLLTQERRVIMAKQVALSRHQSEDLMAGRIGQATLVPLVKRASQDSDKQNEGDSLTTKNQSNSAAWTASGNCPSHQSKKARHSFSSSNERLTQGPIPIGSTVSLSNPAVANTLIGPIASSISHQISPAVNFNTFLSKSPTSIVSNHSPNHNLVPTSLFGSVVSGASSMITNSTPVNSSDFLSTSVPIVSALNLSTSNPSVTSICLNQSRVPSLPARTEHAEANSLVNGPNSLASVFHGNLSNFNSINERGLMGLNALNALSSRLLINNQTALNESNSCDSQLNRTIVVDDEQPETDEHSLHSNEEDLSNSLLHPLNVQSLSSQTLAFQPSINYTKNDSVLTNQLQQTSAINKSLSVKEMTSSQAVAAASAYSTLTGLNLTNIGSLAGLRAFSYPHHLANNPLQPGLLSSEQGQHLNSHDLMQSPGFLTAGTFASLLSDTPFGYGLFGCQSSSLTDQLNLSNRLNLEQTEFQNRTKLSSMSDSKAASLRESPLSNLTASPTERSDKEKSCNQYTEHNSFFARSDLLPEETHTNQNELISDWQTNRQSMNSSTLNITTVSSDSTIIEKKISVTSNGKNFEDEGKKTVEQPEKTLFSDSELLLKSTHKKMSLSPKLRAKLSGQRSANKLWHQPEDYSGHNKKKFFICAKNDGAISRFHKES